MNVELSKTYMVP